MSDWKTVNAGRIRTGLYASNEACGCNGAFTLLVCHELLRVIASDGGGWKHVSVSRVGDRNKVPTWEMMCRIKDLFFEAQDWVVQFHPAQKEYVNNHPGCLHLWKPDAPFPTPPSIMTGIKQPY